MSQALYRKWRPAIFEDVIGQEHVTRTLRNSVVAERVGHAYLFCGPRGTGKTTLARLLAKAVNCLDEDLTKRPCNRCRTCIAIGEGRFLDLIEIDAASNTGVDDIRDLRDKIGFSPGEGRFKVYIIDEVHMLSTAAFNALLKTLEEPPAHAMFVLATTEEHKVPLTIKSRCQQFNFRLLSLSEIIRRLAWIAEQEGLTIEPAALNLVARHGAGSLRDAESLLDQLVTAPGDTITLERAQMVLGTASDVVVSALTGAWLDSDGITGLRLIHDALASGVEARQFCRQMVSHLRQVLLLQAAGNELELDLPAEQRAEMLAQAQRAERDQLVTAIKTFSEAALTPATSWQPQLPLELAFIELLPAAPVAHIPQPARVQQAVGERPDPAVNAGRIIPNVAQTGAMAGPLKEERQQPSSEATVMPAAISNVAEPKPDISRSERGSSETAAKPPEPATPEPGVEAVKPALNLTVFQAQWPAMIRAVERRDKNLPALLAMCKPLAVEGDTLVLGFEYPVLKDKFEGRPEVIDYMTDAFHALIGAACHIRCVLNSSYQPAAAPPSASASSVKKNRPTERESFMALADELGGEVRES